MLKMFRDPLLFVAQALLMACIALLTLGLAGGFIGLLAIPTPYCQHQIAGFLPMGASRLWPSLVIVAMGCFALVLIAAADAIALLLLRIVRAIAAHDGLAPANIARISRIGWLMLLFLAGATLMPYAVAMVNPVLGETAKPPVFDPPINGLLLTLLVFILARVFRQGAALRQDLEGTV